MVRSKSSTDGRTSRLLTVLVCIGLIIGTAGIGTVAGDVGTQQDEELDIVVDPGVADQENDFTFTYDASGVDDDTDVADILVGFDADSDVNPEEIGVEQVSIEGDDTGTVDVDDTQQEEGDLLVTVADSFTLADESGDITISVDDVVVPNDGEFTGSVDFQDDAGDPIVGAEEIYQIEDAGPVFEVTITDTNAPVEEGEDLDATVEVENTGDEEDTQEIELADFDETVVDEESVTLSSGATDTITLTWETSDGDAGTDDITVTSDADSDSTEVSVQEAEPEDFDVTITETTSPVEEGEDLEVTTEVENLGDEEDTQLIELEDFDETVVDDESVTLASGETETFTLTWETSAGDAGTDNVVVTSETDTDTEEVTVESADLPTIEVDPGVSEQENDYTFIYDASLVDESTEVHEIVLDFDEDSGVAVDEIIEDDVLVDGDDTGTQAVDDTEEDAGDLRVIMADTFELGGEDGDLEITVEGVTVPNDGEFTGGVDFQDDAGDTIVDAQEDYQIDETAPDPEDFDVTITETTSPVEEGEELEVTAEIENLGDEEDTQSIALEEFDETVVDEESVTLTSGETDTITLTWETSAGDAGTDTLTVTSETDTDTEEVTIESTDPLEIAVDPGEADQENEYTFSYDAGSVDESTEVHEIVLAFDEDSGVAVDEIVEDDVLVDGDDTGTQAVDDTEEDAGDLRVIMADTFELGGEDGDLEITVEEVTVPNAGEFTGGVDFQDDAGDTIVDAQEDYEIDETVPEPAEFTVDITDTNSPVEEGEDLDVTVDIENVGDEEDTQTIELENFDDTVVDDASVTLDGGETTTITLTWATSGGDAGTDDVTVSSEDDSATLEVAVEEEEDDPDPDPADFEVTITETNSPVDEGEELEVTAEIQNTGGQLDTQEIGLEDFDGNSVDEELITLATFETETITLTWETSAGDAGTGDITVASEDDTTSTEATVDQADGEFAVMDVSLEEETIDQDEVVTKEVTVENTGEVETTQDVELTVGDLEESQSSTLEPGETETLSFSIDAQELDTGEFSPTVSTADDEASASLTVAEADDDDEVPGFGVAVAVIALLTAALLALRRQTE